MAEVLITLGIIGVVAAMTLPTLVQKHRKGVVETGLKKFYTTINQAIKLSEVENGDVKEWKFPDSNANIENFFNQYLNKYIKITNTIKDSDTYTVFFADGSAAKLSYLGHDWDYCIKAKDLENFDTKDGTGCFRFGLYPKFNWTGSSNTYAAKNFTGKGLEPYVSNLQRSDKDTNEILTDENGEQLFTNEKDLYSQKCYAKIIQINGWRIPDDYPLKF